MQPLDAQGNPIISNTNQYVNHHCSRKLSWKAIMAGALVAVGLTFLFNVLTVGLNLSLFTHNENGQDILVFATLAWMVAGGYMILFLSGWIAGKQRCCGCYGDSFHATSGFLHGFLVWTVYLIIAVVLISLLADTPTMLYIQKAFFNITLPNVMSGTLSAENAVAAAQNVQTVNKLGLGTLSTFLIFFMGALGASLGGYCGTKHSEHCRKKCLTDNHTHTTS